MLNAAFIYQPKECRLPSDWLLNSKQTKRVNERTKVEKSSIFHGWYFDSYWWSSVFSLVSSKSSFWATKCGIYNAVHFACKVYAKCRTKHCWRRSASASKFAALCCSVSITTSLVASQLGTLGLLCRRMADSSVKECTGSISSSIALTHYRIHPLERERERERERVALKWVAPLIWCAPVQAH